MTELKDVSRTGHTSHCSFDEMSFKAFTTLTRVRMNFDRVEEMGGGGW